MARARKLTPAAVRAIFKSTESAPKVASRFDVSANLVYPIRQGKIHKKIIAKLVSPSRTKRRPRPAPSVANLNMKAVADAIIDGFIAQLF
jgi:hypothetical protein